MNIIQLNVYTTNNKIILKLNMLSINVFLIALISVTVCRAGWTQNWEYWCSNSVCQSKQDWIYSLQLFLLATLCFTFVFCCLWSLILFLKHRDVKRKYNLLAKSRIEADLLRRNKSSEVLETIKKFFQPGLDTINTNDQLNESVNNIGISYKNRNEIISKTLPPKIKLIKGSISWGNFEELKNDLIKVKKLHLIATDTKETIGFENLRRYDF